MGDGGAEHGVAEPLVGLHRPRRPRRHHLEEQPGEREEAETVARVPEPPPAEQRPGEEGGREDEGDNDREYRQCPLRNPDPVKTARRSDGRRVAVNLASVGEGNRGHPGPFADDPAATPMVTEALR